MRESAERQKLASGWSHDIRTHLNILLGAVGMLQTERLKPDQQKEYIDMIRHNAHAMLRLVNHVLDENQESCVGSAPLLKNLQVDGLIRTIARSVVPYAQSRDLELLYDIKAPLYVYCDAEMIERVLYNLLSNAVKYTDPGGFVYVSAQTNGMYVEINVADTGRGLRADQLDKLAGDMAACREVGRGLSLVRAMMAAMRGHMRCTTQENVGTTFYLQLPAAPGAQEVHERYHEEILRSELSCLASSS